MHQLPRPSPRSSTPATNPPTQPERTNNARERPPHRTRSSVDLASYTERAGGEAAAMATRNEAAAAGGSDKETTKLNQIIQVGRVLQERGEGNTDGIAALPHQSRTYHLLFARQSAAGLDKRRRYQTESLGRSPLLLAIVAVYRRLCARRWARKTGEMKCEKSSRLSTRPVSEEGNYSVFCTAVRILVCSDS